MSDNRSAIAGRIGQYTSESMEDRRHHRRHDLDSQNIAVDRWDATRRAGKSFGQLVDISASGVRIRTTQRNVKPNQQIRVRLELPSYAGISPFIGGEGSKLEARSEWVGWVAITRVVSRNDTEVEIAGKLVDMDEMDRGMLGLYLSTQPMAA